MPLKPLFSTYQQGENRVTASTLAVLQRLGLHLTERILGGLLGEADLTLVRFIPLPATHGPGNPDGEISAQFRFLFEVKTTPGALDSAHAAALKIAYLDKLGGDPNGRLIVLTPDLACPGTLSDLDDQRVVWVNFVALAETLGAVLSDDREPASEHERYLIRELLALFEADGLLDDRDTVVVAARTAYGFYLTYGAYVCQPDRPMRQVARMAFYTGRQIKPEVPTILGHRHSVVFDETAAATLAQSAHGIDQEIGRLIARCLTDGTHTPGDVHDVYLLTPADAAETLLLRQPVDHLGSFAFTMGERYVRSAQLATATTTDQLK